MRSPPPPPRPTRSARPTSRAASKRRELRVVAVPSSWNGGSFSNVVIQEDGAGEGARFPLLVAGLGLEVILGRDLLNRLSLVLDGPGRALRLASARAARGR